MTLLVGTVKVDVAVAPSITEMEAVVKVRALMVADRHGSVTVIVKTVFSASFAGVKVRAFDGCSTSVIVIVLASFRG